MSHKPTILVFIQFTCIGYLLVSKASAVISMHIVLLLMMISAVVLAISTLRHMQWKHFSISPKPRTHAVLLTGGPYSIIRHPMYTSLLLYCLAMIIEYATWDRWLVYLILILNLIFKIKLEEQLLNNHFNDYAEYQQKTYKLIPYMY